MDRPNRIRFATPLGGTLTLNSGPQAFERLCDGTAAILFMGIGPEPGSLSSLVEEQHCVFWCEHPEFLTQLDRLTPGWRDGLPAHWRRIFPEELSTLPVQSTLMFYRQNAQLFPEFWGPLRAHALARRLAIGQLTRARSILLPGDERSLLIRELAAAFTAEGFHVHRLAPERMDTELPALLKQDRPALCLSVNLRGLDPQGAHFHLLRACDVPVAIWMADNPWHLLSSLRDAWWAQAHIYTTDAAFLPALHATGAGHAQHLPLACNPEWARDSQRGQALDLKPLVFVGRTAFPGRRSFFAACRLDPETQQTAMALLRHEGGPVPDVHWWMHRLNIREPWPGNAVRNAGLGAEECSLARRAQWLKTALPLGLSVYGDVAWRDILPELTDVRQPVDYYATLPQIYAQARYSLNITSLLLPSGLSQRHFDVWIAGGFLVTDDTPGLDIFPAELRSEIALPHPRRLKEAITRFENDAPLRAQLQEAWKRCLLNRHRYRHRIQKLCDDILE